MLPLACPLHPVTETKRRPLPRSQTWKASCDRPTPRSASEALAENTHSCGRAYASKLHPVIRIHRHLTGDATHLLTNKSRLADRILVVVKNGGKFLGRHWLCHLLDDRDVIREFGLAAETAVRRVIVSWLSVGWKWRR